MTRQEPGERLYIEELNGNTPPVSSLELRALNLHTNTVNSFILLRQWLWVLAVLFFSSCSHSVDQANQSGSILHTTPATSGIIPDSSAPVRVTLLSDLPDSLQPGKTLLGDTPTPIRVPIPDKRDSVTIPNTLGTTLVYLEPTSSTRASFSPDLQFFTAEQNLAVDVISYGYTDRKGNLWFGTHVGGVSKYDGNSFTTYSTSNGLCDNAVNCILEDRAGNMWFATNSGVSKFDGTTFSIFGNFKQVSVLCEDHTGNIWFGTQYEGLYMYAGDTIRKMSASDGFFGGQKISAMLEDKQGQVWVGAEEGLFRYDGKHFTRIPVFHSLVTSICIDRTGNTWVGTIEGYYKYDGVSATLYPFKNIPASVIYEDRFGKVWLNGGVDGIWYYDPTSSKLIRQFEASMFGELRSMIEDLSGNMWFCSNGKGVIKYSGQALQQLTTKSIRTILEDKNGHIWFGGYEISPIRYDGEYLTRQGPDPFYWCFIEDDQTGDIWFGAESSGLIRFDHKTYTFYTDINGLVHNAITSIIQDQTGILWIGTQEGLSKFDGRSFTNFTQKQGLAGHQVWCVLEDRNGGIYIGTDQGLSLFDGISLTNYMPSASTHGNDIRSMVQDQHGHLWIGTNGGGLIRYDGQTFSTYTTEQGLTDNVVTQVALTREGYVAVGTNNGISLLTGFYSTDPTHNHTADYVSHTVDYPALNSLPNHRLHHFSPIFERYNPGTGYAIMDVNRGHRAMIVDSKGVMWVASGSEKSGLMRFDYSLLDKNDKPLVVNITGIKVNDEWVCWNDIWKNEIRDTTPLSKFERIAIPPAVTEEVTIFHRTLSDAERSDMQEKYKGMHFDSINSYYPVPQQLELPYRHNKISIEFAAIEPGKPTLVQYQYMLEGYDKNWSTPSNNTSATYGNIHEGSYQFFLKARSPSGIWSEPITYSFTVLPPWWRSWWAYSGYGILFAAIAYGAVLILKRRLRLQMLLKQEHDEAIRLKELDTFKSQLFTNLTHEFRTPLTVILGMARQLSGGAWKSTVASREKARMAHGLQLIENNGHNLLHIINQLLDLSKLENKSFNLQYIQGDIIPYLRYVTSSFESYAEGHDLTLSFSSDTAELIMDFDPEQIKQVLTNLISNAIKFTPAGGEIQVSPRVSGETLLIFVRDTGIGISEKDLPHIMDRFYQADSSSTRAAEGTGIGLAHTQELLKVMGGSIEIESETGKGTCVIIQLPIRHEAEITEKGDMTYTPVPNMPFTRTKAEPVTDDVFLQAHEASGHTALPQLLLIEDNPDLVDYLRSCLEPEYHVITAFNGKVGVEKAVEETPDFIISDVMMPEMDGYQVCDRLKNDERTSHIPILLLTAKADAASRLVGLRRGADAYMAKPFSPEELSLQISTLLDNRRRMAAHFSRLLQADAPPTGPETHLPEAIQIEDAFLKKVNDIIEAHHADEDFSLPRLCQELGMSRSQLFRKIKAVADTTPSDMIRTFRLRKSKLLLEAGDASVAEAAYKVGFKDPSYFSKLFQEEFGLQPHELRK